jgi:hypothetical protein
VFVDPTCTGGGSIRNIRSATVPSTSLMTVSPLGWSVDQPDTGNGDVGLGGSGTSPGPFANQTIAAHFPPANASRTIGYLPDFAVILNLEVIVYEAFNGSPSLIVRIQGPKLDTCPR